MSGCVNVPPTAGVNGSAAKGAPTAWQFAQPVAAIPAADPFHRFAVSGVAVLADQQHRGAGLGFQEGGFAGGGRCGLDGLHRVGDADAEPVVQDLVEGAGSGHGCGQAGEAAGGEVDSFQDHRGSVDRAEEFEGQDRAAAADAQAVGEFGGRRGAFGGDQGGLGGEAVGGGLFAEP